MKKRILSFFLAALMVVGCVGTFAIGASAAGEIALSVAVKVTGNKANVQVMLDSNPGFAGLEFKLEFDKTVIKPIGFDEVFNASANKNVLDTVLYGGQITTNLKDDDVDKDTLDYVTFVAATEENYAAAPGKLIGYSFEILNPDEYTELNIVDVVCVDQNEVAVTPAITNSYVGELPLEDLSLSGETEVVYDGNVHGFTINGLGEGMKVQWTVNDKKVTKCEVKDAGTYNVTAVVSKTGYKSATLTATLTISKAPAKLTGVELWSAVEGTEDVAIKSTEAAAAEANGRGYPVVFSDDAKVVKDGDVYKIVGVTVANTNIELNDTTVEPNFVSAAEIVDTIVGEADVKAPFVSPSASELPVPAEELPYGYEFVAIIPAGGIKDAEGNVVIDEEGNILRPEETLDIEITYGVKDETGAIVKDDIVFTVEITKSAAGADLAMLILYFNKKLAESKTPVEAVKANIDSATVPAGTEIVLTTATEGAVIHYTTDGTTATVLSPVYTAPIVVNEDVVINAIATKSGMKTSGMTSFTYTITVNEVALKADAANIKYMEGRGDNFEPNANATRYEVIKAIANLFDINTTNSPLVLTDVAEEYKELVNLCTAAGIIKGYEDKTFRGEEGIIRAEVATIICNVMKLDVEGAEDAGFKDVSGWATNYVNACANAGYVQGKGEGEFAPSENITRAELATLFNNITGAEAGTSCSYADVDADAWYFGYVAAAAK